MEQTGHYYTVYFTSLAVGFSNDIAFKQAYYAQMPDQIDRLDATSMHLSSCFGGAMIPIPMGGQIHIKKIPIDGPYTNDEWRALIEYVLHAFPYASSKDISSQTQQAVTKKLLETERPDSLAFGFLLHRLGDAYAHIDKDNYANMYPVAAKSNTMECIKVYKWGHFKDGHDSDYPFVRPPIFYSYLEALHQILLTKVTSKESDLFRRHARPMDFNTLKTIFKGIIEDPMIGIYQKTLNTLFPPTVIIRKYVEAPNIPVTNYMIRRIRQECYKNLGVEMKEKYKPEKEESKSLSDFLKDNEIKGPNGEPITEVTIRQTVERLNRNLQEKSPQAVPDYTNMPAFDTNKDISSIFQSWPR